MKFKAFCFSMLVLLFGCNNIHPEFKAISFENEYKFGFEIDSLLNDTTDNYNQQIAASEQSFIGNYWEARTLWRELFESDKELSKDEVDDFLKKYQPVNATNFILKGANKSDILIINEAHHVPFDRVYIASLLDDLYQLGYRYLGLETLGFSAENDSLLNLRGVPKINEGYYTREPQMANLIRDAIDKGFYVFGYESENRNSASEREQGQAENIANFMNTHKNGKVLLYCGYAHAYEGHYNDNWGKAIAGRLHELTGINPFTVDQAFYFEDTNKPHYKAFVQDSSVVYVDESNQSWQTPDKTYHVDAAIFHARSGWQTGRPKWYASNGRQFQNLTLTNLDIECPCLIMVYPENYNYNEVVPTDIVYINGINTLELKSLSQTYTARPALRKGKYNLIVTNFKHQSRLANIIIE